METKDELIKSITNLLKLIEDGDLVRDISKDNDFMYFTKQAARISTALIDINKSLEYLNQ